MKLVRNSVFETNSSSCHSISVGKSDVYLGFTPNDENKIVLPPREFGWENETHSDVESRLVYVWIYIRDWTGSSRDTFLEMYKKVVFEHTGADGISMKCHTTTWGVDEGYIDHQSVESGDLHDLFDSESRLKSFLFGRDSCIETGNDNGDY